MKKCPDCNNKKDLSEFGINVTKKDGHTNNCKPCRAAWAKRWYKKNRVLHMARAKASNDKRKKKIRSFIFAYLLEHPCVDCGEANPMLLEFDHVRWKKSFHISRALSDRNRPLEAITNEIVEKCDVRCIGCHRLRTAKERGYWILDAMREAGMEITGKRQE